MLHGTCWEDTKLVIRHQSNSRSHADASAQILPQESSLAEVLSILTSGGNLQGQGRKSYCKSLVLLTKYVKKYNF